jgi:hypothetical protein
MQAKAGRKRQGDRQTYMQAKIQIGEGRQAVTGIQEEASRLASQQVGKCWHEKGSRMQEIIDSDTQAGMDESGDRQAEAARQRAGDRLAVTGTKRQACRQPTGRHEAGGGRQEGS